MLLLSGALPHCRTLICCRFPHRLSPFKMAADARDIEAVVDSSKNKSASVCVSEREGKRGRRTEREREGGSACRRSRALVPMWTRTLTRTHTVTKSDTWTHAHHRWLLQTKGGKAQASSTHARVRTIDRTQCALCTKWRTVHEPLAIRHFSLTRAVVFHLELPPHYPMHRPPFCAMRECREGKKQERRR